MTTKQFEILVEQLMSELGENHLGIRIVIQYLMFDIEATRRERDILRTILESKDL